MILTAMLMMVLLLNVTNGWESPESYASENATIEVPKANTEAIGTGAELLQAPQPDITQKECGTDIRPLLITLVVLTFLIRHTLFFKKHNEYNRNEGDEDDKDDEDNEDKLQQQNCY
jgi:hypothetical protein